MVKLMMSPIMLLLETAKTSVLKLFVSHLFVYIEYNHDFCFVQWGGWEGTNKADLQLDLYDLISCSCWDTSCGERVTRE